MLHYLALVFRLLLSGEIMMNSTKRRANQPTEEQTNGVCVCVCKTSSQRESNRSFVSSFVIFPAEQRVEEAAAVVGEGQI